MVSRSLRRRRAFGLAIALMCLGVLGLIFGALLAISARERLSVRTEERRAQAEWLAQAGLERAAAALAHEPAYTGEAWQISANELNGVDPAMVRIEVAPVSDRPWARVVTVHADYPSNTTLRARASLSIQIDPAPLADGKDDE